MRDYCFITDFYGLCFPRCWCDSMKIGVTLEPIVISRNIVTLARRFSTIKSVVISGQVLSRSRVYTWNPLKCLRLLINAENCGTRSALIRDELSKRTEPKCSVPLSRRVIFISTMNRLKRQKMIRLHVYKISWHRDTIFVLMRMFRIFRCIFNRSWNVANTKHNVTPIKGKYNIWLHSQMHSIYATCSLFIYNWRLHRCKFTQCSYYGEAFT